MAKKIIPLKSPDFNLSLDSQLLGKMIRARRTQSDLRLEDTAALCGVAKQTLMRIERGESTCQLASVLQICAGLGIKLYVKPWDEEGIDHGER